MSLPTTDLTGSDAKLGSDLIAGQIPLKQPAHAATCSRETSHATSASAFQREQPGDKDTGRGNDGSVFTQRQIETRETP